MFRHLHRPFAQHPEQVASSGGVTDRVRQDGLHMRKLYEKPMVRKVDAHEEEGKRLLRDVEAIDRRRSQRVMIQIPVHAYFQTPDGKDLRVDAFTLSVNAHGCLLTMDFKPDDGQRMRLVNPKSAVGQSGKVVRAQRARDGSYAVAFEFDAPAPQLWSIVFPPADWQQPRS